MECHFVMLLFWFIGTFPELAYKQNTYDYSQRRVGSLRLIVIH